VVADALPTHAPVQFMAYGIAGLGVVATRSVVERRQQIGMLRAIGFKRRMVQAGFLLESSLITLIGTALGVALGLPLAAQLIAHFARTSPGLEVVIPWLQIVGIVALAYLASLLTTYLPAWQASRIYPADGPALRVRPVAPGCGSRGHTSEAPSPHGASSGAAAPARTYTGMRSGGTSTVIARGPSIRSHVQGSRHVPAGT